MTETPILGGGVDNGRRGMADLKFYSGPVGIRDHGDSIEVAFFGAPVKSKLPIEGTLDGAPVNIVAIMQRALSDAPLRKSRSTPPMQSIVATVIPAPSE